MTGLPLLAALLLTQSTPRDSLPFHRGEWAAQFAGAFTFTSVGFLKFRSPAKALVLDIRVGGSHGEEIDTDSTGPHFADLHSVANVNLRFGLRHYHSSGPRLAGYYSFGLVGGFAHFVSKSPGFRSQTNGWNTGVFGDVGASYFLAPKFSVGATIGGEISYAVSHVRFTSGDKQRTWTLGGNAPGVAFVAALYF